ncbi:YncE family protein [Niallia endozanthoxylica]|uniref:YncE family protein n=1 Tax=Niallia endozanthoxylica TaxID=2036016 RepID=A0A5J5HJR9_9BACI|nr:YncE family protein [Niallia endozanthoxylica]KAA9021050.1 YncE family protein [Niallia endozanthoxylica]
MNKLKLTIVTLITILGVFLAGCSTGSNQDSKSTKNNIEDNPPSTEATEDKSSENPIIQYYFTANEGGSISKIDTTSNEVAGQINVEGAVHNVQVSPNGEILGATVVPKMDHGGGSMEMNGLALFYDTHSNELLKTVEVGNHPAHIVFTEDGKYVLVTNNEENNVSVIDTESFTITQTINTGNGPHGFRISADSQRAYIANMGEDTVSVLDLKTMKEEKKIKVGSTPVTTAITSDGNTLVVTLNEENMLAIIDLETDQVEKVSVGNGPAQVYMDANNQLAFVANQGTEESPSNSVSVVELASKKVISTVETGEGSHGVVTSSENKWLYVTNMFENTVSVIDIEQKKVIDTIEVGEIPNGITIMKKN